MKILLNLLLVVLPVLVFSQSITLKNWIAISKDNWPPNNGNFKPFYFLHKENARNPVFTLNPKFIQNVTLITKPSFSFKYWTDTDLGLFLVKNQTSHHHNRDLKLIQSSWQNASIDHISPVEWTHFKYENSDEEFTLAFKDVSVHYTERLQLDALQIDPIHGYRKSNYSFNIVTNNDHFVINANRTAFVSFIDSQPTEPSTDTCYWLTKANDTVPIELYLTYPNATRGLHLDTYTQSANFCLTDYIALRLLQNYQLTFNFPVPSTVSTFFTLSRKEVSRSFALIAPFHYSTKIPFTSNWHYFNSAFNYQIEGPQHISKFKGFSGDPANFFACDIIGNCFPYKQTRVNKDKVVYDLEKEYINELAISPFVRIKCDKGAVTDDMYKFSYDRK